MISNCSIGLCVLFNLILLGQGLNTAKNNVVKNVNNVGLGIGFPESEEENPDTQHILVRILYIILFFLWFPFHLLN